MRLPAQKHRGINSARIISRTDFFLTTRGIRNTPEEKFPWKSACARHFLRQIASSFLRLFSILRMFRIINQSTQNAMLILEIYNFYHYFEYFTSYSVKANKSEKFDLWDALTHKVFVSMTQISTFKISIKRCSICRCWDDLI